MVALAVWDTNTSPFLPPCGQYGGYVRICQVFLYVFPKIEENTGFKARTITIKMVYHPYCSRANAQSPLAAAGLCVPMDSPFWLTGWQSELMSTAMTGDYRLTAGTPVAALFAAVGRRGAGSGRVWFKVCHFCRSRAGFTRGEIDDSGDFWHSSVRCILPSWMCLTTGRADQVQRLLDSLASHHRHQARTAALIILRTGLRVSESWISNPNQVLVA